jgi:hypothetical protein
MELVKHALANHARGLVGKVLSINSELASTWLGKGMLSLLTSRACLVCYVVQDGGHQGSGLHIDGYSLSSVVLQGASS